MPYSFHSHSGQFCHHGHGILEDVVKEAIRKGFHTYGLSEHMPRFDATELYPEEHEAQCTPASLKSTFDEFQNEARRLQVAYADQIQLLVAAEIEFIHPGYADYVAALQDSVDYVVGSLHHVGKIPIDFSVELYQQALERHGSLADLYAAYFDEQFVMLQSVQPRVVGHFDLVRIFAGSEADKVLHEPAIWQRIVRNVEYVIKYDGLFEINSRSWKKGLVDAYPQRDIVQLIQDQGGKFTLSDDCHGPRDVGMYYDRLHDYLAKTGIDTVHYLALENGKVVLKEHRDIVADPFWNGIQHW
ncbi:histidinolphosphatase [Apophysomyces sp. BC1034]|nr:histidinolphosphatase [Apophysomyces sp. BC1015]KAG0170164.1 histidinolphosphatase [Apophysomyces sp. BC1021]KAG0184689.1 histidinolphosphatase [Apophysomyces sp. BC1034]